MIVARKSPRGITLTEILIAIMILGVGLVSLATLFPIGLLRLRDATRFARTKYLVDSAAGDSAARGLFNPLSFMIADNLNTGFFPFWYPSATAPPLPNGYNPLIQDTGYYGAPDPAAPGVNSAVAGGYGLPFAYDPLWRAQTVDHVTGLNGYYLDPIGHTTFEARFGSGIGFIRDDRDGFLPSAHGLQRLTNFNRPAIMPAAAAVPSIFVSPEDVVWVEPQASNQYANLYSPVLPDLDPNRRDSPNLPIVDWHYSWMFTGYQVSSSGGCTFEGNIVIWENRPFGIGQVPNPPGPPEPVTGSYAVDGETVVEAIWGHSGNIAVPGGGYTFGYGAGADRTVLLRWYAIQSDPVVRPGDWIADVTYERSAALTVNRFLNVNGLGTGLPNPFNKFNTFGEWDNLPAQRCFWYQVQKVTPAIDDPYPTGSPKPLRSMVVYVDRTLQARTMLTQAGVPAVLNAALIAPNVVNVIPQQISARN
jgi:type II secretory pathway pseudopilin PulG